MVTNLLWTGREYHSIENCLVKRAQGGNEITSVIVGYYNEILYKVDYHIKTTPHWETLYLEIHYRLNDKVHSVKMEGDGKGNWLDNGQQAVQFNGCIDVDLPLTPFTNSLPINRLQWRPKQWRQIQVIYFDLLNNNISVVKQKYRCLSNTVFHYENVPNDFESIIQVDEAGLVLDYPALFKRTAALQL